ncbi:MAG: TadE/TadG family type IV pilus assembly protein [Pseudomonadota bacterium]
MRRLLQALKRSAQRLRRDERGLSAIETVVIVPMLFWALAGTFVMFNAFKTQTEGLRATNAIADAISRETSELNGNYITSLYDLTRYMARGKHPIRQRITIVCRSTTVPDEYRVAWSVVRGPTNPVGIDPWTSQTINTRKDDLPIMPVGDQLILVETMLSFRPVFGAILSDQTLNYWVFTRPRFTNQVKYQGQPNWVCPNN